MSEPETQPLMDAPNQQAVRPDGSGPADEGTGGTGEPEAASGSELDELTKDELLSLAADRGVEANTAMNKAEIKAAIEAG